MSGLRFVPGFPRGLGRFFQIFFRRPFVVQVLDHPPWKASDLKATPPTGQIRMGKIPKVRFFLALFFVEASLRDNKCFLDSPKILIMRSRGDDFC